MPALNHDLYIEQGTSWAKGFRPRIGPPGATVPFLAPGWTVKAQVRSAARSGIILHEWSNTIGNAGLSGDAVVLSVSPAESAAWLWPDGYYDLEVTNPAGDITHRIAQGRVLVSPEITR